METYNPEKHLLLADEAHKCWMYKEDEIAEFIRLVQEQEVWDQPSETYKMLEVFEVRIPDFPPAHRTPLALIMTIGGGPGDGGPFADKPWTGVQLACRNAFWEWRAIKEVGKSIVPNEAQDMPDRLAYAWQVEIFSPAKHIPAREWCHANGIDIVYFFREKLPEIRASHPDAIKATTNPFMLREQEEIGSFSPEKRCIDINYLRIFEATFLDGQASEIPEIPEWPGWDYDNPPVDVLEEGGVMLEPTPERVEAPEPPKPVQRQDDSYIAEGAVMYPGYDIINLLRKKLGTRLSLFGDQTSDRVVVGITKEALWEFLKRDDTNKKTYVKDIGGRNFDCDDFSVLLRAALSRHGVNACGIIWGDVHAWNFFILVGDDGPEVIFIEPQTDGEVKQLGGQYSIERRCDIYL